MREFETFYGYKNGDHRINESDGKGDCALDRLVYQASSALENVESAFLADLESVARDAVEQIAKEKPDLEKDGDDFADYVRERIAQITAQRYVYNNELVAIYGAMCEEIEDALEDAGMDPKEDTFMATMLAKVAFFASDRAYGYLPDILEEAPPPAPSKPAKPAGKPKASKPATKAKPKG